MNTRYTLIIRQCKYNAEILPKKCWIGNPVRSFPDDGCIFRYRRSNHCDLLNKSIINQHKPECTKIDFLKKLLEVI